MKKKMLYAIVMVKIFYSFGYEICHKILQIEYGTYSWEDDESHDFEMKTRTNS